MFHLAAICLWVSWFPNSPWPLTVAHVFPWLCQCSFRSFPVPRWFELCFLKNGDLYRSAWTSQDVASCMTNHMDTITIINYVDLDASLGAESPDNCNSSLYDLCFFFEGNGTLLTKLHLSSLSFCAVQRCHFAEEQMDVDFLPQFCLQCLSPAKRHGKVGRRDLENEMLILGLWQQTRKVNFQEDP